MNILLVDDEPLTLRALKTSIDWPSCGIDSVYTAFSASDAKKVMDEHAIQLMLVDVEMPKENGLQLLKWTHDHKPDIIYSVVTGHDDFHYIKSALQLRSVDYLLKPVQIEELLSVLDKMTALISDQQEVSKTRHYAEQWIHEQQQKAVDTTADKKSPEELIGQVESYYYEHMRESVTLDEVAGHFYLSPDYLNRLYKKLRGTTLNQYLIRIRMDLAADLLREGKLTATVVAGEVGYASYPTFVNTFKKIYSMTPAAYQASVTS